MPIIQETIRLETDKTLSFGNYEVSKKQKVDEFTVEGDIYRVKTHNEVTKLKKNSGLLFESVPGATVHYFKVTEKAITFKIEGYKDTEITMELEPQIEYKILIDGVNVGSMKANSSGKINFSMELSKNAQDVKIEKII